MRRIEVERSFPASPEALWAIYVDHARWQEWAGVGASRLARTGEGDPNGVGAIRVLGPGRAAAREEVVAFDPPRRMVYRLVGGGVPMRDHEGEVELVPEGERTRIVWRCRFEAGIPGTGWLLERVVRGVFTRALAGLARVHFPERASGAPGAEPAAPQRPGA